jgi:hypothetical protein
MTTRHIRYAALLLVTGLVGAVVPQAAAAARPVPIKVPVYGYVWGNQSTTASYVPDTGYELNSTGGTIQIDRYATGRYYVRFAGMGRDGGIAHAGAYGSNDRCVLLSYFDWGDDEYLHVGCFDIDGEPADTRFIASFTTRKPAGVGFGYLLNDNPVPGIFGYEPPAASSHDGAGQPIRVYRGSVGVYQVDLGAFAQDVAAGQWQNGFLAATVYGSYQVTCHPHGSVPSAPNRIRVTCADLDGQWADAQFALTYARDTSLLGTPQRASVTATGPDSPVVEGWTNSAGGAPTVTELGTGHFQAAFPSIGAPRGHAYATLMNTSPMYCNVYLWWRVGSTEYVRIRCFDPGVGEPHPVGRFTIAFLP